MHSRLKWHLTLRMTSLPVERCMKKAAKLNPDLNTKHRTNRSVGRPKKKWKHEVNDLLKPEETEETKDNEFKKQWYLDKCSKNRERWTARGTHCAVAAASPQLTRYRTMWPRKAIWHNFNSSELIRISGNVVAAGSFQHRTLSKYVTLSIDSPVSFKWAAVRESELPKDYELKPPDHESLSNFSGIPYSCPAQNLRIPQCWYLSFVCFLLIQKIYYSTRLLIPFPARLCALSSTVQQVTSLSTE